MLAAAFTDGSSSLQGFRISVLNSRSPWLVIVAGGKESSSPIDVLPKTNPCDFLPSPIRFELLLETFR